MREQNPTTLQNWSTSYGMDVRYLAPECRPSICLQGRVYNHPCFQDGDCILTSAVDKADGRLVTTASGATYRLGRPDQKWLHWLKRQGLTYDPKQPVKGL